VRLYVILEPSVLPGIADPSELKTMADEKETGFKVSDRRMFNPDGSLRQADPEPEKEKAEAVESAQPAQQGAVSGNVVSFPGEAETRRSPAGQEASPRRTAAPPAEQAGASNPTHPLRDASLGPVEAPEQAPFPEASFTGLVNMLAVEAVMHLGLIENPMGGGRSVDLESARHVIDMLGMLQQKTRGNLTPEEAGLINDVVADLRMQFVAVSRGR
jgi:hypothetical protein